MALEWGMKIDNVASTLGSVTRIYIDYFYILTLNVYISVTFTIGDVSGTGGSEIKDSALMSLYFLYLCA